MGHSAFELVCVLCQSLAQPTPALDPGLIDWTWRIEAHASIEDAFVTPRPQVRALPPANPSLGEEWTLRGGRELRLNLTPTPDRCAPLVALTF